MYEKRSITLSGHATSLALEPDFWAIIDEAAREDAISMAEVIRRIDEMRARQDPPPALSSACRVWALNRLKQKVSGSRS